MTSFKYIYLMNSNLQEIYEIKLSIVDYLSVSIKDIIKYYGFDQYDCSWMVTDEKKNIKEEKSIKLNVINGSII